MTARFRRALHVAYRAAARGVTVAANQLAVAVLLAFGAGAGLAAVGLAQQLT